MESAGLLDQSRVDQLALSHLGEFVEVKAESTKFNNVIMDLESHNKDIVANLKDLHNQIEDLQNTNHSLEVRNSQLENENNELRVKLKAGELYKKQLE